MLKKLNLNQILKKDTKAIPKAKTASTATAAIPATATAAAQPIYSAANKAPLFQPQNDEKRFLDLGCDAKTAAELQKNRNSEILYRSLKKYHQLLNRPLQSLSSWQIACLSGDPAAIQDCITKHELTNETKTNNKKSENALQLIAISGSISGMELVRNELKIDFYSKNLEGSNALSYAVLGGNILAVHHVKNNLNLVLHPLFKPELLATAAYNEDIAFVEEIIKLFDINPTVDTNLLLLASHAGNVGLMEHAVFKLKISTTSKDKYDMNALLYAAWKGHRAAMEYAAVRLGIDPEKSKSIDGGDVIIQAARSKNLAALKYAVENLKMDPKKSVSKNGTGVFVHAAAEGTVEILQYLKTQLGETLQENTLRKALQWAEQNNSDPAVIEYLTNELNPSNQHNPTAAK